MKNWIPLKLYPEDGELLCRWFYVGDKGFSEPFFEETASACRALAENRHFIRSMGSTSLLPEWVQQMDVVEPTAFIFHISRCGSTLVSQMLGLQPANIVLSEVPFFDDLLRYGKLHDRMPGILPQLKAAIGFYGARRNQNQQRLFIKTDSWHIHFYKELRALYPTVPFFLLYRKPQEVLRSQQKKRGMQAMPLLLEPGIFGFTEEQACSMQLDEYMAKVIEGYLEAFLDILQKDKLAYAINYHEGMMSIVDKIRLITRLPVTEEEMALMQDRLVFHAKFPKELFNEETPDEPIPSYLKRSCALYEKLELLRTSTF